MTGETLRLVFLASNNGSAMRAVQQEILAKKLNAEIVLLVSNKTSASALGFAERHHIATEVPQDDAALLAILEDANPDLIMLSGYLKKISAAVLAANIAPILNIHPSLLPKFGGARMFGMHVHHAVIAAGEKITGATLHLIDEHYDQGKIITQYRLDVSADDTAESLADRVMDQERQLVIATLQKIAASALTPACWLEKNS